jgi:hypothetical protein
MPSTLAARGVVLLALLLLGALTVAGPAGAAKSCGKKVVDDWYADGRVDGTYPAHCYDDAIEILPRDVRDYSSAADDIGRALTNRLRGLPAPPATSDPTPDGDETTTTPLPTDTTPGAGPTGKPNDKPGDPGGGTVAGGDVDTASADSVPIPLLVLGGLALLLVAAGSAGYVVRRFQARRIPPPAV